MATWGEVQELFSGTVAGPTVTDGGTHNGDAVNGSAVDLGRVADTVQVSLAFSSNGTTGGDLFFGILGSLDGVNWYNLIPTVATISASSGVLAYQFTGLAMRYIKSSAAAVTSGNGTNSYALTVYGAATVD